MGEPQRAKIAFINDWKYLFKPWAIGGRFASFTFIHIGYFDVSDEAPDLDVNGFSIIILGLGVRINARR